VAALRAAFLAGSADDLARAGDHLSVNQLADVLAGEDRELALAAARAAPTARDGAWLLAPLGEIARSPDRPLAAAAARAAARIAGGLDFAALLAGDAPPDWVRARLAEYRAVAASAGRWPDVRVASLDVAAHLAAALGEWAAPADAPWDWARILADPEPEVRRAAFELSAGPLAPETIQLIGAAAAAERDPAAAAAAIRAACAGLAFGDAAAPVLAALGRRGLARARAIVANAAEPAAVREAAAECLAASRRDHP